MFNTAGKFSMLGDMWGFDNSQNVPGMMDAASRFFLNWVDPFHINTSGTYFIDQSCDSSGNTVYLIDHRMAVQGEFFLIENRNKDCYYDRDLAHPLYSPSRDRDGAAIWHVHWPDDGSKLNGNLYRNDDGVPPFPGDEKTPAYPGRHYMVELVAGDGQWHIPKGNNHGDNKDLFKKSDYVNQHGGAGYRIR
jgi:hypothetical protein